MLFSRRLGTCEGAKEAGVNSSKRLGGLLDACVDIVVV
jgi:hypothetical protein